MKTYIHFLWRCFRISFVGDWRYHLWMLVLTIIALFGLNAYCKQFVQGLATTGMTDQVSWGMYIANFTFLVGMAAAAVMLVIPVYIYKNRELRDLVIFGELLAIVQKCRHRMNTHRPENRNKYKRNIERFVGGSFLVRAENKVSTNIDIQ